MVSSLLLPGLREDTKRPTLFSQKRHHQDVSVLANIGNNIAQRPSSNNVGLFAFAKEHDEESFDDITCSLHKRMTREDKTTLEKKPNSQIAVGGLSSMFSTKGRQHHEAEKTVPSSKQPPRVKRKPRKKLRRDTRKSTPAKSRSRSTGRSLLEASMESQPKVCQQRRTKSTRSKQQLTRGHGVISTLLVGGDSIDPAQKVVAQPKPKKSLEDQGNENLAESYDQRRSCEQQISAAVQQAENMKSGEVNSTRETAVSSAPINSKTMDEPSGDEEQPPSTDSHDLLPLRRRSRPPRDPTPCKSSLPLPTYRPNSPHEKQSPIQRRKPRDPSPCRRLSSDIQRIDPLPNNEQSTPDIDDIVRVSSIYEQWIKRSIGVGLKRGAREDPPSVGKRIDQKKTPQKLGKEHIRPRSPNSDVHQSQNNIDNVSEGANNRIQSTPAVLDEDDGISDISMTPALCEPKREPQLPPTTNTDKKPSPTDQRRHLFSDYEQNVACLSTRVGSNCLAGDDSLEIVKDKNPRSTSKQGCKHRNIENTLGDGEAEREGSDFLEVEYVGGRLSHDGLPHRESHKENNQNRRDRPRDTPESSQRSKRAPPTTISSNPKEGSTVVEVDADIQEMGNEEPTCAKSCSKPCPNRGLPRRTGRARKPTDHFKFSDGRNSHHASEAKVVNDNLIASQPELERFQGGVCQAEGIQTGEGGVCSVRDAEATKDMMGKLIAPEILQPTSNDQVPHPRGTKTSQTRANQTVRRSGRQRKKTEHFVSSCVVGIGPTPESKSKPCDEDIDISSTTESDEDFSPQQESCLPVVDGSQKQAPLPNNDNIGKLTSNANDEFGPGVKPRRAIRRTDSKVPVLKKKFTVLAPSEWSTELLGKLREAHASVNPTSPTFWHEVACMVKHKTAKECREMWFSFSKTPKTKETKQNKAAARLPADDIFQSTPLRVLAQSAKINATACNARQASMKQLSTKDDSSPEYDTGPTKRGYKTYLNNMRKDVARAEKVKQKVASYKEGGAKTLSEYDAGAELQVRLTPRGTLKIRHNEEHDVCIGDFDDDEEEDSTME